MKRTFSRRARLIILMGILLAAMLVVSCATQPPPTDNDVPGFWSGLLHGFLILFSLIGGIFTDYRVYAFPNAGGWYDFGFVVGAMAFLGGSGASAA